MASVKGRAAVSKFLSQLPEDIANKLLRGAARTAANVIADEARDRSISSEVSAAIKVSTKREEGRIVAKVQVKMGGYNLPLWLEYGTDPHFISVDDSQRAGMSVRKVNDRTKEGSLIINGQFVGTTVWHPGARAHPFLRPALDVKEADAIRAGQEFITSRVTRAGIQGAAEKDDA